MLRELHEVLSELQDGVAPLAAAAKAGVRLSTVEMSLPLDMVVLLRSGSCVLLADVPRNHADSGWTGSPTRLQISLGAIPEEAGASS